MYMLLRIILILIVFISLGGAVYVFKLNRDIKKMQTINKMLGEYVKDKQFLLMKNDGEDISSTNNKFDMPSFSQDISCLIRRKFQ